MFSLRERWQARYLMPERLAYHIHQRPNEKRNGDNNNYSHLEYDALVVLFLKLLDNTPMSKKHDNMVEKYDTEPLELSIGARQLTLLRVRDLERWVDREALLRDETEEPPYWAHLWTGALTLARYIEERVECRDRSVLDLGCGLGLTGIIAALKGGKVTFADKEPEALAFATVNAQMNDCPLFETRMLDFTRDVLDQQFSLILGAEILYDRPTFPQVVRFLAHHLAPNGSALFADARRTNTEAFYHQLDQAGLRWTRTERHEREENLPLTVSVVIIHQPPNDY
jgi:predicted nicotinamide N-methyase